MRRGVPLADAMSFRGLARRTAVVRVAMAALALALGIAAVAFAREPTVRSERFVPAGSNGIVILDLSASISGDIHARIRSTLLRLAETDGRYGLVVFSDVAYEALPPGTPAHELRRIAQYFETRPGELASPSPWSIDFSGGTRIATGVQLALSVIAREQLERPALLLVSDLDDDPLDVPRLRRLLVQIEARGIPIRVVGLNPAPEDVRFFGRVLAEPDAIGRATLDVPEAGARAEGGSFPWALVAACVALAAVVGTHELWRARLRWQT